jgi:hypothetical protein
MRWNSFARSLVFAAVAAAGYAPFSMLVSSRLDAGTALATYAVAAVAVYLVGLASTLRRGVGAALLAALLGAGVLAVTDSTREGVIGAALVLSLCRSGVLYRAPFARALLLEALLLVGGLGLARHLVGPSTLSLVLAVWGFFLVQGVFFLVAGVSEKRSAPEVLDPFEAARAQVLAILEEG